MALLARFDGSAGAGKAAGAVAGAPLSPSTCGRCRTEPATPAVAVLRGDALCGECLLLGAYRKARQLIHDSPAMGHPLAVAVSGDAASACLLSFVRRVMDSGRRPRMLRDVVAVHVDASALAELLPPAQRPAAPASDALRTCGVDAARHGFHLVAVPLEAMLLLLQTSPGGGDDAPASTTATPLLHTVVVRAPPVAPGGHGKQLPMLEARCRPAHDPAVLAAVDEAAATLAEWRETAPAAVAAARLRAAFTALASPDARQGLLEALTRRALVTATAQAGVPVLATAETADAMAAALLASVCKGAGFSAPLDSSAVDYRHARSTPHAWWGPWGGSSHAGERSADQAPRPPMPQVPLPPSSWYACGTLPPHAAVPAPGAGVMVVRPLLEVETTEAAACARVDGLSAAHPVSFTAGAPARTSVDATIAGVLAHLQRSYVSTVHNVARTARKLRLPPHAPLSLEEDDHDRLEAHAAIAELEAEEEEEHDEEEEGGGGDDDEHEAAPAVGHESAAAPPLSHHRDPFCPLCGGLLPLAAASANVVPTDGDVIAAAWLAELCAPGVTTTSLCSACSKIAAEWAGMRR